MLTDGIEGFYDWTLLNFNFPKPARWRIFLPIFVAFLFAQVNSLGLVTTYIPSTIRTTFRFRYGALGSLHDPDFQKMRTNGKIWLAMKCVVDFSLPTPQNLCVLQLIKPRLSLAACFGAVSFLSKCKCV
jgi:hypothetical protein